MAHTHGGTYTREFSAWQSAKTRCYNTRAANYPNYGGRGITMCDRWRDDFTSFLHDVGPCPPNCSLDRVDTNGHYTPDNCRWATPREQSNNTRTNRILEFRGERRTMMEWARHIGLSDTTLCERLRRGWSIERALTEPAQQYGQLAKMAAQSGLKHSTISRRLALGWSIERATSEPLHPR